MSAIQLDYLATLNPHPRDAYITFEEETHTYTIRHPQTNISTSSYTSVTTWCHQHFSEFNEDQIIDKMMKSKRWTTSKYYGMTPEMIKEAWEKNRQEASQAGTQMHADIERYYNLHPVENQSVEYEYFLAFEEMRGRRFPTLEPYRTEWIVFHEDWEIAGSIDMLYRDTDTNELWIYDWKRSKEIKKLNPWQNALTPEFAHLPDSNFWHYALQLNTYRAILESRYGMQVAGMCLVCLHPNHPSYQRIVVPRLTEVEDYLTKTRGQPSSLLQNNHS